LFPFADNFKFVFVLVSVKVAIQVKSVHGCDRVCV
jgi:hypothetical protein